MAPKLPATTARFRSDDASLDDVVKQPVPQPLQKVIATGSSNASDSVKSSKVPSKMNLSASGFVLRRTDPRTPAYFYSRRVVLCSAREAPTRFHPIRGPSFPKVYIHASALVHFAHDVESICHVCPSVDGTVNEFRQAYDTLSKGNTFLGPMRPAVESVVRDSFCAILHIVESVRAIEPVGRVATVSSTSREPELVRVHNEATYRHQWDQLIQAIVNQCGKADLHYEREATLFYPENPVMRDRQLQEDAYSAFSALYPPPTGKFSEDPYGAEAYWYWREADRSLNANGDRSSDEFDMEPTGGKADSIICLTVPSAYSSEEAAKNVSVWKPSLAQAVTTVEHSGATSDTVHFTHSVFAGASARPAFTAQEMQQYHPTSEPKTTTNTSSADSVTAGIAKLTVSDPGRDLEGKLHSPEPSSAPLITPSRGASNITSTQCDLHIPLFASEFKKNDKGATEASATDQGRLYLVAIVTFLHLFNISRFPVFGLVTSGPSGVMTCAWADKIAAVKDVRRHQRQIGLGIPVPIPTDVNYDVEVTMLADQHATVVDLRNPMDAVNVATFIAYIILEHAPLMRQLFSDGELSEPLRTQYLADTSGPSPFEKARQMKETDGAWKKERVPNPDYKPSARKGKAPKGS